MSLLSWWRYGALKKALLTGRGAAYDARSLGNKTKLAVGTAVLLNDTRYSVEEAGKGPSAWTALENDLGALSAVLTCARCGYRHAIRAHHHDGLERLAGGRFGRFDDRYQGAWQGPWFKLFAPLVHDALGRADELVCQDCAARSVPQIRLY